MKSEGILDFHPEIGPLRSISPSRFLALRTCALREIWDANRTPRLLPASPAAHLGTVVHRLLEEAAQGELDRGMGPDIRERWQVLLSKTEEAMAARWLERHLVPLASSVRQFNVREIQARERAAELLAQARQAREEPRPAPANSALLGTEIGVSSTDKAIVGYIDAVLPSPEGPIIRDYKSGAIYEQGDGPESAIKATYQIQLKLYAALYASTTGTWPVRLEIAPLQGEPQAIPFDPTECQELAEEARQEVFQVNRIIDTHSGSATEIEDALASPTPAGCSTCPYRPGCVTYQRAQYSSSDDTWPRDVWGTVVDVRRLGNGKFLLQLDSDGNQLSIRGLSAERQRHPALERLRPGEEAGAFNLAPTGSSASYAESTLTTIYCLESSR